MDLHSDGTATVLYNNEPVTLRSPTMRQYRELRDTFNKISDSLITARDAIADGLETETQKTLWNESMSGKPVDDEQWAIEDRKAVLEALSTFWDAAQALQEEMCADFWVNALRVLGGVTVEEPDLLPQNLISTEAIVEFLAHLRENPFRSGRRMRATTA